MTHISKWEEFRIDIPPFKTNEWRVLNKIPDSDVVENILGEMADSREEEKNPGVMSNCEVEQRT